MRPIERVRIFSGGDPVTVEQEYNKWYLVELDNRQKIPALRANKLTIFSRSLTVRQYEGEETYAIAVFYEHFELDPHEMGPDRGTNVEGVSMIPGEKPRKR